jgi:hypothetical protein
MRLIDVTPGAGPTGAPVEVLRVFPSWGPGAPMAPTIAELAVTGHDKGVSASINRTPGFSNHEASNVASASNPYRRGAPQRWRSRHEPPRVHRFPLVRV